jgi:hypothetical protein
MRTTIAGLSLVLLLGCGGGGGRAPGQGGGPGGPTQYTLVHGIYEDVPPGSCLAIEGPYAIPAPSTMSFTIDDTPGAGSDAMEAGVIRDADYLAAGGCDFSRALVDDVFVGSFSDSGPAAASSYDFIVGCSNYLVDCVFYLTWNATY